MYCSAKLDFSNVGPAYRAKLEALGITGCCRHSTVSIKGVRYCGQHAGIVLLNMYKAGESMPPMDPVVNA